MPSTLLGTLVLALILLLAPTAYAQKQSQTVEAIIEQASSLSKAGKPIEGAAILKQAISSRKAIQEKQPENIENLYQLAELQVELQRDDEALATLTDAIRIAPKEARLYALQARLYVFKRRETEAIQGYKKAAQLDSKNPVYSANWASILMTNGRYDLAVEGYKKALEADPKHLNSLIGAANCHAQLNQFDQAIPLAARAAEADPKSVLAELIWAESLHRSEKNEEAIPHYKAVIALQPENEVAYAGLVQIYEFQKNVELRDANIEKLYELYKAKKTSNRYFCRDRFFVGKEFVEVFELFELGHPMGMIYRFHVSDAPGDPTRYLVSLGSYDLTTQAHISLGVIKEGERAYHLDLYRRKLLSNEHLTFKLFGGKKPSYEETKELVQQVISGKLKPLSGSQVPSKSDEEEKEKDEEKEEESKEKTPDSQPSEK